jgi:diguanylate cyclase
MEVSVVRRLALMFVVVAAVLTVTSSGVLTDSATAVVDNGAQLVAGVLAAVACWWTSRRLSGPERWWRQLMSIGMAAWSVGQAIWSWYQVFGDRPIPSPSLADVGYLALPAFALVALLTLAVGQREPLASLGRTWLVVVVDAMIVIGSLLALSWSVVLEVVAHERAESTLAFGVAIAYPITDLLLVIIVVLLWGTGLVARPYRSQLWLLGIGLVALSISDSAFAYLVSSGASTIPPFANAGFIAGPAAIMLAALTPANYEADKEEQAGVALESWYVLLPFLPVATAGLLVVFQVGTGLQLSRVEITAVLLVTILLLTRQMITLMQNTALLRRASDDERRMTYLAYHDQLTGLANSALFSERLDWAIDRHKRRGDPITLLFIDLDEFKLINDSFGHAAGDRLLTLAADRIQAAVRGADLVARVGGDEFAVLLVGGTQQPQHVGERILAILREPFTLDGRRVAVSASIGIAAPASGPGLTADGLLRRADAAMYAGKNQGRATLVYYRPNVTRGLESPDLPSYLAESLAEDPSTGGFSVVYQPILRLTDRATVGVEALARWSHPIAGPVTPDVFIPIAERAGSIAAMDNFVLDRACRDAPELIRRFGRGVDLHVNISSTRLGLPELTTSVQAALSMHHVTPTNLVLEITETSRIADLAEAAAATDHLRSLGVRIALDDFGAGFNSLTQLHSLPIDVVKLDRGLTEFGPNSDKGEAICRSILVICDSIGINVVAEGVDTNATAARLARVGIRFGQGYLYARPAPLEQLSPASYRQ